MTGEFLAPRAGNAKMFPFDDVYIQFRTHCKSFGLLYHFRRRFRILLCLTLPGLSKQYLYYAASKAINDDAVDD